jgi:peptidoglycan/LPS O-acetylase OafA/YrhL
LFDVGEVFLYTEITNKQLNSIQLLRAIAALSVVYFHYLYITSPPMAITTGAWGVDIFFVISGFIMAYITSKNTDHFLVRRLFRIMPLYFLATFLTIFVALISPQLVTVTVVTFSTAIKSLLFIPYNEEIVSPIVAQGWTLNFEIVFYLIMALSIVIIKNKKYTTPVCGSILVLFVGVLNISNPKIFIFNYYQKYQGGLFPEFIYGLALYYIYSYLDGKINKPNRPIKHGFVFTIIFVTIAIMSLMYLILGDIIGIRFFDNRNIYYGIPAFMLVLSFLLLEKQINVENIIIKFGLLLGEASYATYLFHWYVILFMNRIIFPRIENIPELLKLLFIIIITILISICIYEFIDKPIQKYLRNILRKYNAKKHTI